MNILRHETVVSSSTSPALSIALSDALMSCRDAIAHPRADGFDLDLVRARIRRACVIAREDNVPVEVLLIQLKHALNETITSQSLAHPSHDEHQQGLISFLVRAYYSDGK
jgi:hypothetical protein